MNKKRMAAIFLSFAIFFLTFARTEAQEKKYNLGFNAGFSHWPSEVFKYLKFHQQESFSLIFQQADTLRQEIKLKTLYDLNFQYNFNPRFGIQAEIGYQKADYNVQFILTPKIGSTQIFLQHQLSWSLSTIFLNLIYRTAKPESKVIPYGLIGLGLCFVRGGGDFYEDYYLIDIPSTTDLGFQVGAGLTLYFLPETIPLGIDIKLFLQALGVDLGRHTPSSYGSDIGVGGWNMIWGIKLGLKYRF